MRENPALAVGSLFDDRYEIKAVAGEGGMATVYRAYHQVLGKDVALKVLHLHRAMSSEQLRRFQLEAKVVSSLSHPNITSVNAFGNCDGVPYVAFEFLVGKTLADIVAEEGPLSFPRFTKLLIQIAEGLKHAHENGIVHRDLKPANIFVLKENSGEEIAKIVDFGLAKLMPEAVNQLEQSLTATADVIGTPLYMSPEQTQKGVIDRRTDIYSLGCVMYFCATGKPPFSGETPFEVLYSHQYLTAPNAVLPADYPNELNNVILRCIQKDPADRYSDCAELERDLRLLALGQRVKVGGARRTAGGGTRRRINSLLKLAAVFCVALAVGATWWQLSKAPVVHTQFDQVLEDECREGRFDALKRSINAAIEAHDQDRADNLLRAAIPYLRAYPSQETASIIIERMDKDDSRSMLHRKYTDFVETSQGLLYMVQESRWDRYMLSMYEKLAKLQTGLPDIDQDPHYKKKIAGPLTINVSGLLMVGKADEAYNLAVEAFGFLDHTDTKLDPNLCRLMLDAAQVGMRGRNHAATRHLLHQVIDHAGHPTLALSARIMMGEVVASERQSTLEATREGLRVDQEVLRQLNFAEKAMKDNPVAPWEAATLFIDKGAAYWSQGNKERAAFEFGRAAKALAEASDLERFYFSGIIGDAFLAADKPDLARKQFEQVIALAPTVRSDEKTLRSVALLHARARLGQSVPVSALHEFLYRGFRDEEIPRNSMVRRWLPAVIEESRLLHEIKLARNPNSTTGSVTLSELRPVQIAALTDLELLCAATRYPQASLCLKRIAVSLRGTNDPLSWRYAAGSAIFAAHHAVPRTAEAYAAELMQRPDLPLQYKLACVAIECAGMKDRKAALNKLVKVKPELDGSGVSPEKIPSIFISEACTLFGEQEEINWVHASHYARMAKKSKRAWETFDMYFLCKWMNAYTINLRRQRTRDHNAMDEAESTLTRVKKVVSEPPRVFGLLED